MALIQRDSTDTLPMRASANVSALSYTTTNGVPTYSSGGIPFGTCVVGDTGTGFPIDVKAANAVGQVGVIGIATDYPAVGPGTACNIQMRGVAKVLVGGVVNPFDYVYVGDTSGRVTTQPGVGNYAIVGQAVGPVTVQAGDYMAVNLMIVPGKAVLP
jgi:hypothetical protein